MLNGNKGQKKIYKEHVSISKILTCCQLLCKQYDLFMNARFKSVGIFFFFLY